MMTDKHKRARLEIEFARMRLMGVFLKLKADDFDADLLTAEVYSIARQLTFAEGDLHGN